MDTSVDKELGRGPRKSASKKHKAVPIAGEHRELSWEQRYAIPISIFIRSVHLTTTGLICPYMIYQGNDTLNFAYPVVNCVFFICWVLVYVPRCIPWVLNRMFSPSKVVFVEVFAAVLWLIDCILIAAKAWDGDCARGTAYYFMGAPQRACEIGKALIALTALSFVCSVYAIWAQRLYWGGPPYNDEEITILQFGGIFRKDIPVEYDRITGLPRRRGARFRDVRYAGIDGSGGGTISGFYGVGSGDGGGGGCGGGDGGGGGCGGGGGGDGGGGGGCC